jgi:hypothetical protein
VKIVPLHIALHRLGVTNQGERESIIAHTVWIERLRVLLRETRAIDHAAYVQMRAGTSVFDLIEADGEAMLEALTVRGNFTREEISLMRVQDSAQV